MSMVSIHRSCRCLLECVVSYSTDETSLEKLLQKLLLDYRLKLNQLRSWQPSPIWDDLGLVRYIPNRKHARKRVFIGLKICVVILKNFIPLNFASLTSTSAKNMSWSYKYDYNVILKRAWKLNMLIGSYRRKVPKAHINFICIFLQNSRGF